MCEWDKYGHFRIDPCMRALVDEINAKPQRYRTIMCCCGHGRYEPTVIVKDLNNNHVYEYFTGVELPSRGKNGKIKKRYYKRDKDGYYYLPF